VSQLDDIANYCNEYLRVAEVTDYPNALNGLQIANSRSISRIGAAVDFSTRAVQAAIESGVNLLIVHHGIFWSGLRPVTNQLYRQLKLALDNDLAVYSAHLPLDAHSDIGNNILLIRALGCDTSEPFLEERGFLLGQRARVDLDLSEVVKRLENAVAGPVKTIATGPPRVSQIGVITGGAGGDIERVAAEGIDTFITGEAPHWAAVAAEELGLNLLLGGHYATETFGVKSLSQHLSDRFGIPWTFIDLPTGL
jgi:dinuclear metal center YbgI/SA1388 family protein